MTATDQLAAIQELFGSIAFPETPEERDAAEAKILALVREQAAAIERVRALCATAEAEAYVHGPTVYAADLRAALTATEWAQ